MALYDLCLLSDVKTWLGRTDANSDAMLSALITRASRQIYSYLHRGLILPRTITELRDGTGGPMMMLRQWPVLSVALLVIEDQTIPEAPAISGSAVASQGFDFSCNGMPGIGWTLEAWDGSPPGRPQALSLNGFSFGCSYPGAGNAQNTQIVYQAGYQVSAEPQTVANATATVIAPYGSWASDMGVSYADGTALVAFNGAPAVGQYQLTPGSPGSYTFNAGDDGAAVLISYGYIPADLADACIELVSERFRYSQRIGERTHSLGGNETISFDNTRFTPLIAAMLEPYRQLLPI
jgi:hypothetical protein